jgi:hypothetical protein
MKKRVIISIAVIFFIGGFFSGNVKYDAEEFSNTEKMAKKLVQSSLKKLKKLKIKKLVILECYGEFLQSREVSAGAFEKRHSSYTMSSKSTIKLDKDYYTNTTNAVYDMIKQTFEKNGIEIVPIKDVMANKTYQDYNLEEEKQGRGVTSGVFKKTKVTKSVKVSASGLGIFPGAFKMIKVVMTLAKLTHELGADGFLQVNFFVDKAKKGAPIVTQLKLKLSGDIRAQEVGFKGHKKMRYDLYTQWHELISLKKPVESTVNIEGKDKGDVNMEAYDKGLMEILKSVVMMFDFEIGNALGK